MRDFEPEGEEESEEGEDDIENMEEVDQVVHEPGPSLPRYNVRK